MKLILLAIEIIFHPQLESRNGIFSNEQCVVVHLVVTGLVVSDR